METTPPTEPPRPPEQSDFLEVCRSLNAHGAKYVVVGGMAVLHHGYLRATEDIDLLVDASRENIEKVRRALEILPDKAIREMDAGDLERYTVVRIADAIIVDLMLKTAGISYQEAYDEIEWAGWSSTRPSRSPSSRADPPAAHRSSRSYSERTAVLLLPRILAARGHARRVE